MRPVQEAWFAAMRQLQNLHTNANGEWAWDWWSRLRVACRSASRRYKRRRLMNQLVEREPEPEHDRDEDRLPRADEQGMDALSEGSMSDADGLAGSLPEPVHEEGNNHPEGGDDPGHRVQPAEGQVLAVNDGRNDPGVCAQQAGGQGSADSEGLLLAEGSPLTHQAEMQGELEGPLSELAPAEGVCAQDVGADPGHPLRRQHGQAGEDHDGGNDQGLCLQQAEGQGYVHYDGRSDQVGCVEREHGQHPAADEHMETDYSVLMAWDTGIPPWRRTYTVRDRWLKRHNDDEWRRRRHRERKHEHWRGSSPQRSKGKGKSKDRKAAKAKPKARPYTIWTSSGKKEWPAEECEEEDPEDVVVEVDDEAEQEHASSSGPRPDAEPFTVENAMHLWREFLDMEDEGELGYPSWALDRVRDTIEEWPAEDASTLLAAHQQFLSLVMAQVAEIAQRRIARAREEANSRRTDNDDSSLMQASRMVATADDGISTYGLELQFLTDEFSAMGVEKARVQSSLLMGLLAKRYGCASGRLAMGMRATALEAAVVAFDDASSAVENEMPESASDRVWCEKWWKRLLPTIMEEEKQLREIREKVQANPVPETVVETPEAENSVETVANQVSSVDQLVEDKLEIRRQLEAEQELLAWEKARLEKDVLEYEHDRDLREQEDIARYEELQAMYAQDWDDWALWSSMHPREVEYTRAAKRQKMILHLQVHDDATTATKMELNLQPGQPMSLGMTWTVVDVENDVGRSGVGGSQASTERMSPVTPEKPEKPELRSEGLVVSGQGHITEGELTAFMTSEEGLSVYRAWSFGGFSAEQVQRPVMEAFMANKLVLEGGNSSGA